MVSRMRKQLPLAARIRFARQRAGLSLDRLGEQVGTSRQHLIRLEKGLHRPKPAMAARIAEATGVPLDLLTDDDDAEADPWQLMLRAVQMLAATQQAQVRA